MSNTERAGAALRDAAGGIGDAVDDVKARGREAAGEAGDVAGSLKAALDEAIRTRPYTTLLAAGALGFAYALLRRRGLHVI